MTQCEVIDQMKTPCCQPCFILFFPVFFPTQQLPIVRVPDNDKCLLKIIGAKNQRQVQFFNRNDLTLSLAGTIVIIVTLPSL